MRATHSRKWFAGLAMVLFLASANAVAALEISTEAQKEESYVENGEQKTRLVSTAEVVPGDQVVYTIWYRNTGDQPADNVVINDAIPAEMAYLEGSAFGSGADVVFSADGGQTFGSPDELVAIDETGEARQATASDYTHIRFTLRNSVPPNSRGFVRFRAEVK